MPDAFSSKLGQISNKSPPPITSCPSQFTPGASKEEGEGEGERSWSWPKNNSSRMFSLSQRHKAALSNIYQKAVPDHCAEGGSFSKKRSLKMILKHLYSSTLDLAFFLSGLALKKEIKHLYLPSIQFSDYMGQYRIFFILPDASCKSFNALGSWERICICMMGLHNK